MDKVTQQRINTLHPAIREEVTTMINFADKILAGRAKVRITQALRTVAEQDALYAQGRTKPGKKVTNAKGGSSYHNYGLAFDFVLLIDGKEISWSETQDFDGDKKADWMEFVTLVKSYPGWEWGGDFRSLRDSPHFQKTFGLTTAQAYSRVVSGKNIDGVYPTIR
jgi:peptidoglycan L-alanyl-D-glutamate endopeptidase CwlK